MIKNNQVYILTYVCFPVNRSIFMIIRAEKNSPGMKTLSPSWLRTKERKKKKKTQFLSFLYFLLPCLLLLFLFFFLLFLSFRFLLMTYPLQCNGTISPCLQLIPAAAAAAALSLLQLRRSNQRTHFLNTEHVS